MSNKLQIISFSFCIFAENFKDMEKTDWKNKATTYAHDKKLLKKRIKELSISRDKWKEKAMRNKTHADKLEAEFDKIKKKLIELASPP